MGHRRAGAGRGTIDGFSPAPLSRLFLLLFLLVPALAAHAQAPGPPLLPTITFGGRVQMDRMDVRAIEGVRLRLIGVDTLRRVVRVNAPAHLQAGQRYENVRVTFDYRVSVAALDSVLRPLLGLPPRPAPPDSSRR